MSPAPQTHLHVRAAACSAFPQQPLFTTPTCSPLPPPTAGARCSVYCATSPDLDKPKMQGCYYLDSNCAPIAPSRQVC